MYGSCVDTSSASAIGVLFVSDNWSRVTSPLSPVSPSTIWPGSVVPPSMVVCPPQADRVNRKVSANNINRLYFLFIGIRYSFLNAVTLFSTAFTQGGQGEPAAPWVSTAETKRAHTGTKIPMHAQKFCYVLYTTCITHLAKSAKLHYTEYVVLLTQLCMVGQSPVQGIEGCRPLSLPH